ncbi:Cell cycle control protein 50A [Aphanomyces cochlioides]|nr:Cell cycle control protein 50A [Aphanomyces cochlioides]
MTSPTPTTAVADINKRRELKHRPDDSKFTQQTLRVWKPILTLQWAIGVLSLGAIVCLILGGLVLQRSSNMSLYRVLYDAGSKSNGVAPTAVQSGGKVAYLEKCHLGSPQDANSFSGSKTCFVTVTLDRDIVGDTIVFYELAPFYQTHRRYMTSQVLQQYMGGWSPGDSTSDCDPVLASPSTQLCNGTTCFGANKSRQHYPCGLVANTMFNDIFWLHNGTLPSGQVLGPADLKITGIARRFTNYNFKNPLAPLDLDTFLPIWHNPNYSRIIPPPGSDIPPQVGDTLIVYLAKSDRSQATTPTAQPG